LELKVNTENCAGKSSHIRDPHLLHSGTTIYCFLTSVFLILF